MAKLIRLTENDLKYIIMRSVRRVIQEEMSINNSVVDETDTLYYIILDKIKEAEKVEVNDGYWKRIGSFDYLLFDNLNIKINFTIYCFKDAYSYSKFKYTMELGGQSSYGDKTLTIKTYSVSGKINEKNLKNTLQHEIEHLFQAFRQGRKLVKDDSIYNIALNKANDEKDTNKYKMFISQLIYLSRNIEQEGFLNGLYQDYLNDGIKFDFQNTEIFQILKMLLDGYYRSDEFKNDNNFVEELNYYGITPNKFKMFCLKAYKRLKQKASRVIAKARKDYLQEHKDLMISMKGPYLPILL